MNLNRIDELISELETEIAKGRENPVDEPLTRVIDVSPLYLWVDLVRQNRKKIAECFD